jgi:hypothetical protein
LNFYRPDPGSHAPSVDGAAGLVTADTASVLETELCLPGSEARRIPLVQCRNNWRSAEMPVGYHRNVSVASLIGRSAQTGSRGQ